MLCEKIYLDAPASFDASRPAAWFVVDQKPVEEGWKSLVATYESDPSCCFHTNS
jgi:torulene dioxygenase